MGKEERFTNVGCELWVAVFVFVVEYETVGFVSEVKCLVAAEVVSLDDVFDVGKVLVE